MDRVPYDFIERTILLAPLPERVIFPFTYLSGHWGRFAARLKKEIVYYYIHVEVFHFPDIYFMVFQEDRGAVRCEELLQKKRTSLTTLTIYIPLPDFPQKAEKMDDQNNAMLQNLLRRSNGLTKVDLTYWTWHAPLLTALLEAIPRIRSIEFSYRRTFKDGPAMLPLVEKHVRQRCLRKLLFYGPLPGNMLPVARVFLKEAEFYQFKMFDISEERESDNEVITLIAEKLKKQRAQQRRVVVLSTPFLLDKMKKEMGEEESPKRKSFWRRHFRRFGNHSKSQEPPGIKYLSSRLSEDVLECWSHEHDVLVILNDHGDPSNDTVQSSRRYM
uniref:FBD domain-containing protein n=1 Tax=Steinernema glaseri TaxID=37863 RepID=A0A1I7Z707_9BILA